MNTNPTPENKSQPDAATAGIGLKAILRFIIYIFLMPLALFLSAGTLDWVNAWILFGFTIITTLASRLIVLRVHPDLLGERARYAEAEDAKGWDRLIVAVAAIYGPLVVWIVAGLDWRFGWTSPMPLSWQIAAMVVILLGYGVGIWAMAVNRFFSAVVRIQTDRGHTTVTTGPYRFVRHPSYIGGLLAYLAIPVFLESIWALVPVSISVILTIVRTALEDRTLLAELEGYRDYAQRVRYRLIPGIW
ncbi:MAG: isoprenylcysteine carboxylmethyltransferase family protein [Fidelibacterota bacterium]|nr:MAG: isoprenylcysteine carboxylmethyltransferase family protein [Candidatus Neomarinimicrobiota bacterium]